MRLLRTFSGRTNDWPGNDPPAKPTPASNRQTGHEPTPTHLPQVDHRDDYDLQGALLVTYSNGDVQELPLSGHIMHPALELRHAQQLVPVPAAPAAQPPQEPSTPPGERPQQGAAAAAPSQQQGEAVQLAVQAVQEPRLVRDGERPLHFGRVHVSSPKPVEVTLLNPTLVDALWAVTTEDAPAAYCRCGQYSVGSTILAVRVVQRGGLGVVQRCAGIASHLLYCVLCCA